tara:strand:+ start:532 stop:762 length:231 start_codon:yes stop_codon:yes gene_type:complete
MELVFKNHYDEEPTHYVITEGIQVNFVFPNKELMDEYIEESTYVPPRVAYSGSLNSIEGQYVVEGWEVPEGRERKS